MESSPPPAPSGRRKGALREALLRHARDVFENRNDTNIVAPISPSPTDIIDKYVCVLLNGFDSALCGCYHQILMCVFVVRVVADFALTEHDIVFDLGCECNKGHSFY